MTSPIGPITSAMPSIAAPTSLASTSSGAGSSFSSALTNGLNQLQQVQGNADKLALQAADGSLPDPAQYMIATTQASLATELTVAVRDKAVDAFNEIMRMQG